ncbi:MAG: cobalamin B12-binding domain-containing protein [Roseinatronobacter sp.]|nr:MAG: cobalamin B12-binding domain-containing protein [Roseinatronobacter sp.]
MQLHTLRNGVVMSMLTDLGGQIMESRHSFDINPALYTRTQSLFDAKRRKLPPDAVERLAREVVERLAEKRDVLNGRVAALPPAVTNPELVNTFCDILLAPDASIALRFLEESLSPVVAERGDLYGYIAAASRQLGERWDADEVTYLQVTLAVGKLYAVVRSVGASRDAEYVDPNPRKYAVFANVPGEQHTLGVSVAAEVFRDAGWEISLQLDRSHAELVECVSANRPAVIGLSLSSPMGLDPLVRLVIALRLALPTIIIAVAGGDDTDEDTLRTLVDLDLVITNAEQAQSDLSRILSLEATA